METSEARFWDLEIRQQPGGAGSRSLGELRHDMTRLPGAEAIEKEMGHDQIVTVVRRPCDDVVSKKCDAPDFIGIPFQNLAPRQIEHSLAAVHAIDSDQRLALKKLGQKSPIPLAHDERPGRGADFAETCDPSLLQRAPERDRFQGPIPQGNGIEAHNIVTKRTTSGVRRTRSASAVRSSLVVEKLPDAFR